MTFEERGAAIRRRRLAHGLRSLREFADRAGVSREAVTNAERGTASEGTYLRLEAWLDGWDHELGEDEPANIEQLTFVIEGQDVSVTVKGPIGDREALKADVADIIRSIRSTGDNRATDA